MGRDMQTHMALKSVGLQIGSVFLVFLQILFHNRLGAYTVKVFGICGLLSDLREMPTVAFINNK